MTSAAVSEAVQVTTCPSEELQRSWDSVIVEPEIKSKLLYAIHEVAGFDLS